MKKTEMRGSASKAVILAVSGSQADLSLLRCLFTGSSWELATAESVAEARVWLQRNSAPLVLCERLLPDGDWKDLLAVVNRMEGPPRIIVTSRQADDELWIEALNFGAFDVLRLPARPSEVFSALSSAWRNWHQHNATPHRPAAFAAA